LAASLSAHPGVGCVRTPEARYAPDGAEPPGALRNLQRHPNNTATCGMIRTVWIGRGSSCNYPHVRMVISVITPRPRNPAPCASSPPHSADPTHACRINSNQPPASPQSVLRELARSPSFSAQRLSPLSHHNLSLLHCTCTSAGLGPESRYLQTQPNLGPLELTSRQP